LEELGFCIFSRIVDPAVVVSFNVAPSRLKLIPEIPEELALENFVKNFLLTVSELVDLFEIEMI
jgi:hypothetical protein